MKRQKNSIRIKTRELTRKTHPWHPSRAGAVADIMLQTAESSLNEPPIQEIPTKADPLKNRSLLESSPQQAGDASVATNAGFDETLRRKAGQAC